MACYYTLHMTWTGRLHQEPIQLNLSVKVDEEHHFSYTHEKLVSLKCIMVKCYFVFFTEIGI